MHSNCKSNKRYFKRKALQWTRLCYLRKLCYFYKFYKNESPQYLFKLVPLSIPLTPLEMFHFFPRLLSSGKVLTITFKKSEDLVYLKAISSDLSNEPPMGNQTHYKTAYCPKSFVWTKVQTQLSVYIRCNF